MPAQSITAPLEIIFPNILYDGRFGSNGVQTFRFGPTNSLEKMLSHQASLQ